MLRRIYVSLLVLFVILLVVAEASDRSPRFRAWLDDTFSRVMGTTPGEPSTARAPAAVTPGEPSANALPAPATPSSAPASPAEPPPAADPAAPTASPTAAPEPPVTAPVPAPPQPGTAAPPAVVFEAAPPEGAGPPDERPPAVRPPAVRPPDTTPPQAPARADAQATGERSVRLSWSPAQDDVAVTAYEVQREGRVVAVGPEAAAVEEGLTPLSTVCYEVVALDGAGNRSKPSPAACATLPDLTPPTPPTVVMARALSETAAALTWSGATDVSGVVSYDLVRAGAVVSTSDSARATDDGLSAGRTFCWTVRARDPAGNVSGDSTQACATMPDLTPPAPPPGLVAAPSAASRVAFGWQPAEDNVGVERYEVFRDGRVVARTTASKLGGVEGGLAASTEYCFTVVAVDGAGNRSPAAGPACARTTEPGVPAGPTALQASPKPGNVVVLRWDSSPDPGMVYAVYRDGDRRIGATPRTEFTVAGLRAGEKRCYRVAAVDGTGKESPRTIEACAAPELRR